MPTQPLIGALPIVLDLPATVVLLLTLSLAGQVVLSLARCAAQLPLILIDVFRNWRRLSDELRRDSGASSVGVHDRRVRVHDRRTRQVPVLVERRLGIDRRQLTVA
jgi:hypothetical protein